MTRRLFEPTRVGPYPLSHRVVMAPLTRMRADAGDMPNDLMVEYYTQRASQGGLIIAESASVSVRGRAYLGAPGIYHDLQASEWRQVTEAIHAKGSTVFLQIWHGGRESHPDNEPFNEPALAPSAIAGEGVAHTKTGWKQIEQPREITRQEIAQAVEEFRSAAARAVRAGFDGVEIHAANGYLIDEFIQDGSNKRTDEYGGPVENRARFLLEVTDAAAEAVGAERLGVRISPSTLFGGMHDSDPAATFGHVATELDKRGLAYLHVIEPRVSGDASVDEARPAVASADLRPFYSGTIIAAGGFSPKSAEEILRAGHADLVAFGRSFIANPDLPARIRAGLPLNPYHRETFYHGAENGYIDYPFAGSDREAIA